jgi:hypothetical protein
MYTHLLSRCAVLISFPILQVAYEVGSLVGFWINYGINQNMGVDAAITFRIPLAIQIIPGGLLALGTLILRESPTLLWRKGKREQAIKNLCYLRQLPADHQYMLEEVGRIEARLEEEERLSGGQTGWLAILRGSMTEMKTPSIRFRLAVIVGMFMFQNWSGSICKHTLLPMSPTTALTSLNRHKLLLSDPISLPSHQRRGAIHWDIRSLPLNCSYCLLCLRRGPHGSSTALADIRLSMLPDSFVYRDLHNGGRHNRRRSVCLGSRCRYRRNRDGDALRNLLEFWRKRSTMDSSRRDLSSPT